MANLRLSKFAWSVLAYTVPVILFGAFVRAGLHGDGCGAHWPDCNGALIPEGSSLSEIIEISHRYSSAVLGMLVLILVGWTLRAFSKGHPARKSVFFVLFFTLAEAAVGALLVKLKWVALDESTGRVFTMCLHLVNTFLLLGCMALTAHFAGGGERVKLRRQGSVTWAIVLCLAGMFLLGATGAISALGDTIFPVQSLQEGLQRDLSPDSHPAERLRMLHPLIATSVGLFIIFACGYISKHRSDPRIKRLVRFVIGAYITQMALGFLNLFLLAPIVLQIIHLAVSDAIWIAMVLVAVTALAESQREPEVLLPEIESVVVSKPKGFVAMLKAYISLTKPRVVSLLVFTTVAAMLVAAREWPGVIPVLLVSLGGYMAAGAANTFNMVYERDLDMSMERTSHRPTVLNTISAGQALVFGFALAIGSFALLWSAFNLLAAMMAMAGLLFYFFIYTMALKRRTSQNIVIGGAAGAFPPLVGYAAVTGSLDPIAWYLFAIIFLWTPVHFWALALLIKDDYAKAGIPMLPVVKGDRATVVQIGVYTALTAVVTVMPLFQGHVGWIYLIGATLLNIGLIVQSVQLVRFTDHAHARSLFKFSMVYLALLFVTIAVDRMVVS